MTTAFIYDAVRTPRGKGRSSGSLYVVRPTDLLQGVLRALETRNQFDPSEVEDVVMGCVTQTGEQGTCIARFGALAAGWEKTAGVTMNRFCGSGLEAVNHAAAQVASGFSEVVVAGGVESMSRVKMGADMGMIFDPKTQWQIDGSVPQGISGDLLATLNGITRKDADEFALASQKRASVAIENGKFKKSLVPVMDDAGLLILDRDEYPRPDATLEALSQLQPAFQVMGELFALNMLTKNKYPQVEKIDHVHTAGNSSGIVDGAAAVLLASESKGKALGWKPRAKVRAAVSIGTDPTLMLDGPMPATEKALKKAGMKIGDIDLFEVNEAFAAVPLAFMKHFDVSHDRVNVNGGAIALGHPLGATGAMLLGTLLDALEEQNKSIGLVTLCIGGGMGIATIIERV